MRKSVARKAATILMWGAVLTLLGVSVLLGLKGEMNCSIIVGVCAVAVPAASQVLVNSNDQ